jgi:quercetin dioxygenase-like cupin family protein
MMAALHLKGMPRPHMPSTPEVIQLGQIVIRFLLEGSASGGSIAMFEFEVGPGAKVPIAHSHDAYEETLYGLEGTLTMTVNGQPHEVCPGDVLCIARGAIHRFDNFHSTPSRTLAVITPGVLGPAFFREVAEVARGAAGGPPDPATIAAVMRRHGLTPAPPAFHPSS